MAVDPSLTCSGWALFDVQSGRLLAVGKVKSREATFPLAERLADLQEKIMSVMESIAIGEHDWMMCEAPTTMRDPHAAIKVEQVRGIFETIARVMRARVPGRLNPRTVHHEVLGIGGGPQLPRVQVKQLAVQVAERLFAGSLREIGFEPSLPNLKKNQDIVDAVLLGYLGLTRLRSAEWGNLSPEALLDRRPLRRVAS